MHQSAGFFDRPNQPFPTDHVLHHFHGCQIASPSEPSHCGAAEFGLGEQASSQAPIDTPKANCFLLAELNSAELGKTEICGPDGNVDLRTQASMNGHQRRIILGRGTNLIGASSIPPAEATMTAISRDVLVDFPTPAWEQPFEEVERHSNDGTIAGTDERLRDMEAPLRTNLDDKLTHLSFALESSGLKLWARRHQFQGQSDFKDISVDYIGADDCAEAVLDHELSLSLFKRIDNPFHAARKPFNESLKILRKGGDSDLSSPAFQAGVQKSPDHFAAWTHLGPIHEAISKKALAEHLDFDSQDPNSLMGLAIAYFNEDSETATYRTLERWLSIIYPQIISPDALNPEADPNVKDRRRLREKVTAQFTRAAQIASQGDAVDLEVQIGVGVLFLRKEDYTKAYECFDAVYASTTKGPAIYWKDDTPMAQSLCTISHLLEGLDEVLYDYPDPHVGLHLWEGNAFHNSENPMNEGLKLFNKGDYLLALTAK